MKRIYNIFIGLTIASLIMFVASFVIFGLFKVWIPIVVIVPICIGLITTVCIFYFKNVKFECPTCHTLFKGSKSEAFWAMHTPTKRRMTCPNCKEKKWCKDIFEEKNKE